VRNSADGVTRRAGQAGSVGLGDADVSVKLTPLVPAARRAPVLKSWIRPLVTLRVVMQHGSPRLSRRCGGPAVRGVAGELKYAHHQSERKSYPWIASLGQAPLGIRLTKSSSGQSGARPPQSGRACSHGVSAWPSPLRTWGFQIRS